MKQTAFPENHSVINTARNSVSATNRAYHLLVLVNLSTLEQRVVSPRENCFSFRQGINLASTRCLPCCKVRQQPIAITMHLSEVFVCQHCLFRCRCFLLFVLQQLGRKRSLLTLFVLDRFCIIGALCGGISDELLVLFLALLLFTVNLLDLFIQVGNHHIHHGDDSSAFLTLLCVRTECLRWRRWCHLCERCFVKFWRVELIHAILRHVNQLFRCVVGGESFRSLRVFLLSLFCGRSNLRVQSIDAVAESLNFFGQSCNALLGICHCLGKIRDFEFQFFDFVLCLIYQSFTVLL